MNITIGNTKVSSRNVKARFVVAAAGLALSVSAMAAVTFWSGSTSKPSAGTPVQISAQRSAPAQSEFVYYLVSSQQEAVTLQSAIGTENYTAGFEFRTLVVDTPESEALIAYMTRELMQYAPTARLVDLRQPAGSPVASNADTLNRSQVEANMMAAVISTERAHWEFVD